jgi:hypothetical protein
MPDREERSRMLILDGLCTGRPISISSIMGPKINAKQQRHVDALGQHPR